MIAMSMGVLFLGAPHRRVEAHAVTTAVGPNIVCPPTDHCYPSPPPPTAPPYEAAVKNATVTYLENTWGATMGPGIIHYSISGNYAVTEWTVGPSGGSCLLTGSGTTWSIDVCSGGAMDVQQWFESVGVDSSDAASLASQITAYGG